MNELLRKWDPQLHGWNRNTPGRAEWLIALPDLTRALVAAGGADVADVLLAECWAWLDRAVGLAGNADAPSRRTAGLDELVAPAAGLLVAASVHAPAIVDGMTTLLDDGLLSFLTLVLGTADERGGFPARAVRPLRDRAVERLDARLARPVRDADDWSITPVGACRASCQECRDLDEFLRDPARRTVEWARNQQYRTHIEERLRRHELPVQHRTIKSGRPYTIALAKSPALFEREAQQRRDDEAARARLRATVNG